MFDIITIALESLKNNFDIYRKFLMFQGKSSIGFDHHVRWFDHIISDLDQKFRDFDCDLWKKKKEGKAAS